MAKMATGVVMHGPRTLSLMMVCDALPIGSSLVPTSGAIDVTATAVFSNAVLHDAASGTWSWRSGDGKVNALNVTAFVGGEWVSGAEYGTVIRRRQLGGSAALSTLERANTEL